MVWKLRNIHTEEEYIVTSEFKIGRNSSADLSSRNAAVSRHHATMIITQADKVFIIDNKSSNGTFVNEKKIVPQDLFPVKHDDLIGFGAPNGEICGHLKSDLIVKLIKCNDQESESIIILDDEDEVANIKKEIVQVKKEAAIPQPIIVKEEDPSSECLVLNDDYVEPSSEKENISNSKSIATKPIDSIQAPKPVENATPKPNPVETNKSTESVRPTSSAENDDFIVISDDEDFNISSSQIFQLSQRIKTESALFNDSFDPYQEVKKELQELDYRDDQLLNYVPIDLDADDMTNEDLLNVLESPAIQEPPDKNLLPNQPEGADKPEEEPTELEETEKGHEKQDETSAFLKKSKYSAPPIIPAHTIENRRQGRQSLKQKRKIELLNEVPEKKSKFSKKSDVELIAKRKEKLKEIIKPKEPQDKIKTKTTPKVKVSNGRGGFLLNIDKDTSNQKKTKEKTFKIPKVPENSKKASSKTTENSKTIPNASSVKASLPVASVPPLRLSSFNQNNKNLPSCSSSRPPSILEQKMNSLIKKNHYRGTVKKELICQKADLTDIMYQIINWPVKWLMEQGKTKNSPPVYEGTALHMPIFFNNFEEYTNTFVPMILLEVWEDSVRNFYTGAVENHPFQAKILHTRQEGNLTYTDCECYMPKETDMIRRSDFVWIECYYPGKNSKLLSHTSFALVENCSRTVLNDSSVIDPFLAELCYNVPFIHVKFTLVMKQVVNKQLCTASPMILKQVSNIGNFFNLFTCLRSLVSSPLYKMVLTPSLIKNNFNCLEEELCMADYLNKEQNRIVKEAVAVCLGNEPRFYLLQGPPGTGKSRVIVCTVLQILLRAVKGSNPLILLTAPSNAAIDALVATLSEFRAHLPQKLRSLVKMIRVGPERNISPTVQAFKLNRLIILNMLRSFKSEELLKTEEERVAYLKKKLGHRYNYEYRLAEDAVICNSNIICTTLNSSHNIRIEDALRSGKIKFTCCIVDEATQCNEIEALLPIRLGIDKFVLVGDPKQLPATVLNMEANKLGFGKSLFTRIANNFGLTGSNPVRMLKEQFRMKKQIFTYPNNKFYEGKVKSTPVFKNVIRPSLKPYLLFNMEVGSSENEYINVDEVEFIGSLVNVLITSIPNDIKYKIGIITPYNAQKDKIQSVITKSTQQTNCTITVNTVDSFQGHEVDIVIISYVRTGSNTFIENENRLNVALTRAKQALFIVGSYTLFKKCKPLYDLREDAKKRKVCIDIKQVAPDLNKFFKDTIFE